MRAVIFGAVLGVSAYFLAAHAGTTFTTKGYYLMTAESMGFDVAVIILGGPYATMADCDAALAALPADQRKQAACHYQTQEPNQDTE